MFQRLRERRETRLSFVVIRSQAVEVPADATGVGWTAGLVGAAGVAGDPPHAARSSAAAARPATRAGLAGMRIRETSDSGRDPRQTRTVRHGFPAVDLRSTREGSTQDANLRRLSQPESLDERFSGGVVSGPVEQVARHVLTGGASQMVKNATLFAPMIAPLPGRDRGRGVPSAR